MDGVQIGALYASLKIDTEGFRRSLSDAGGTVAGWAKNALAAGVAGLAALTAGIIGATKAASDEQVGIARLDAALAANIKNWNGNRTAIEAVIKKREALGFSDDDLRDSLASLVTRFKDVNRAVDVQAVAMDLARLKGISLVDAGDKLGKAMAGNTKVLKELGITVDKNATSAQILAAIQKAAAGQATAYAKTSDGAWASLKIAVQDVIEDVGERFLPMATTLATTLRTQVLPVVQRVIEGIFDWVDGNRPLIDQVTSFVGGALGNLGRLVTDVIVPALVWVVRSVADWVSGNRPLIDQVTGFVRDGLGRLGDILRNVIIPKLGEFVDWAGKVAAKAFGPGSAGEAVGQFAGKVGDLASKIAGGVIDAISRFAGWLSASGTLQSGLRTAAGLVHDLAERGGELIDWIQKPENAAARAAFVGFLATVAATTAVQTVINLAGAFQTLAGSLSAVGLVTGFVTSLTGSVAALALVSGAVALNWDAFKATFPDVAKGIQDIIQAVKDATRPVAQFFDGIEQAVKTIWSWIDKITQAIMSWGLGGVKLGNSPAPPPSGLTQSPSTGGFGPMGPEYPPPTTAAVENGPRFFSRITATPLAAGTNWFAGGLARMNEIGPETAILPPGTRVRTADQTRADEARPGVSTYFNLTVQGDLRAKDEPSVLATLQRMAEVSS